MTTLIQRLDIIIINLKVISNLQSNQRLLFKNNGVSIRDYYPVVTPLIRTLAGESRQDILTGLLNLSHQIDRLLEDFINSPELSGSHTSQYDRQLANDLVMRLGLLKCEIPLIYNNSENGLNAMKMTYLDDHDAVARLDVLINEFKFLDKKLESKIASLNAKFDLHQGLE